MTLDNMHANGVRTYRRVSLARANAVIAYWPIIAHSV
jgi:hypothetical protein